MKRLLAISALSAVALSAQCVMCQRAAEAQNAERRNVLNNGILILLFPPVGILGGFLYLAYKRRDGG